MSKNLRVLYHLTVPPSPMAACDAVVQEVEALRQHVKGPRIHLYPGSAPGTRFPRRWWGMQHLLRLWRMEREIDLHHIFNPDPFPFAILRFLRRPVVYTAVTGIGNTPLATIKRLAQQVHTLAVPDTAARQRLVSQGIANVHVAGTGIDTGRFTYQAPPPAAPFTLMMGSAPWTREQFRSKGIEALLEAAQQRSDLRLVFLWRGVLVDEMRRRVQTAALQDRVQIHNEIVDVNNVLAQVHASVVLAQEPSLVKAYPHSLLESLVAGKPVLVSACLPMAAYVRANACGKVVETVDAGSFLAALAALEQAYDSLQANALRAGQRDFSVQQMVAAYRALYRAAVP